MKAIKASLSKFRTVDEYVHGWGLYYYGAGILLPTRKAEPQGTDVSLHIEIASGEVVLRGEGVVEEVRTNSEGGTVGMVIRFTRLDARSKELAQSILAQKREARTSANYEARTEPARAEGGSAQLGDDDLGAIADAIDQTFDSIFATGSFGVVTAEPTPQPTPQIEPPFEPSEPVPSPHAPAVTAVTEALARLGLGTPAQGHEAAVEAPGEPPAPTLEAEEAGGDALAFADREPQTPEELSALDLVSTSATGANAVVERDIAGPEAPATRVRDFISGTLDAEFGQITGAPDDEDARSPAESLRDVERDVAAAASEGEEAFERLIAASTGTESRGDLVAAPKPKGVFGRFFAWLKSLFGG